MEERPEMERREENQEAKPLEEEALPPFEPLEEPTPTFEPLEEHYPTVEPGEEGREKPPDQEDLQKSTKPPAPEGSQNLDNGEYHWGEPLGPIRNEGQKMEEEDKQDRETGGVPSGSMAGTGS